MSRSPTLIALATCSWLNVCAPSKAELRSHDVSLMAVSSASIAVIAVLRRSAKATTSGSGARGSRGTGGKSARASSRLRRASWTSLSSSEGSTRRGPTVISSALAALITAQLLARRSSARPRAPVPVPGMLPVRGVQYLGDGLVEGGDDAQIADEVLDHLRGDCLRREGVRVDAQPRQAGDALLGVMEVRGGSPRRRGRRVLARRRQQPRLRCQRLGRRRAVAQPGGRLPDDLHDALLGRGYPRR